MFEPTEINDSLCKFMDDHPDPRRACFLMMQFGSTAAHDALLNAARRVLRKHGITLLRADEKHYHPDLFLNVLTYLHGCGSGVAVFERIEDDAFNPNVALEVGYMMALNKPICYLKDKTLRRLPTDVIGKLYHDFDSREPEESLELSLPKWLHENNLRFSISKCSITLRQDTYAWETDVVPEIVQGFESLVPSTEPTFLGMRHGEQSGHTILDFEADVLFFDALLELHNSGALRKLAGIEVVDIQGTKPEEVLPEVDYVWQTVRADCDDCLIQICLLSRISGFEQEADEARRVLPERTSDLASCAIYVTQKAGLYYFHSNYVRRGAFYPTKLCAKRFEGLRNIVPLIVDPGVFTGRRVAAARAAEV